MVHSLAGKGQLLELSENEGSVLADDPRWILVQRIVASQGFQRAEQLRSILLYVSRAAILQPNQSLREYDIAREVLGRKLDFNPASDNIVRAQFSHLRRRLEAYFSNEGRFEEIILTIPRGGYSPVFAAAPLPARPDPDSAGRELPDDPGFQPEAASSSVKDEHSEDAFAWRRWRAPLAILCVSALLIGEFVFLTERRSLRPATEKAVVGNAFIHFLARWAGDVTIVVPDLSLVALVKETHRIPSVAEYGSGDYFQQQLSMVQQPLVRKQLETMNFYRATTIEEATIAFDFKEILSASAANVKVRYARDLHVSDLSHGNSILLGGRGSDPWMSLFIDRINFRYIEDMKHQHYHFDNASPAPGEQPRYEIVYPDNGKTAVGYVDVALTENPSRSGYILLISGADAQANEAAASFLLHGKLPPEIVSLLSRKDLTYFEIFLRGTHVGNESDNSFELVATRPSSTDKPPQLGTSDQTRQHRDAPPNKLALSN